MSSHKSSSGHEESPEVLLTYPYSEIITLKMFKLSGITSMTEENHDVPIAYEEIRMNNMKMITFPLKENTHDNILEYI